VVRFGIAVLKLGFCCRGNILCVKGRKIVALGCSTHFFYLPVSWYRMFLKTFNECSGGR
jgi:hypothetical protein